MLLTIGMIVKNEEKCLRKCLEGISPILERVHSELIIADTGSTDNTIAIAREFTEKVIEIEWEDDFSKARNETVARARGKWYMFLDADECFEDTEDIIRFFNSGEYKKYKSARHPMKNLRDNNGKYSITESVRLFKRNKNTRFVGRIHEGIPAEDPQKLLSSTSVHEGYIFDGKEGMELKKEKFERNVPLLLQEYAKKPSDIKAVHQLTKEYDVHEVYDEMLKFTEIGISFFKKPVENGYYHAFSVQKVRCYYKMEMFEESVQSAREYFEDVKDFPKVSLCAVDIRMIEAMALLELDREEEAIEALTQYSALLEEYSLGNLNTEQLKYDIVSGIGSEVVLKGKFALFFMEKNQFGRVGEFVENPLVSILIYLTNSVNDSGHFGRVAAYYSYLSQSYGVDTPGYLARLETIESCVAGRKPKAAEAFAAIPDDGSDYLKLQRLRLNGPDAEEVLEYFIGSEKAFPPLYCDVIVSALRRGVDFIPFIEKLDTETIGGYVEKLSPGEVEDLDLLCQGGCTDNSIKGSLFSGLLAQRRLNKSIRKNEEAFRRYVSAYYRHLRQVYRDDVFKTGSEYIMPPAARFALHSHRAFACRENGDMSGFVANLRTAIRADPGMKDTVSEVLKEIQQKSAFGEG